MSNTIIKVENVSKLYKLGEIGTGTISQDLNRWWAKVWGKEDPFAKIGESNDRTTKGNSDFVWGLKDISFEVKQGEVLGIIGRNGAGKSTLLKILSKVTTPTEGKIKVKGRIASLLEVGTGFHPELSGRENIYLNGAILGMTRAEISKKFDEIVDFSGVERYIDTPVKRYSSGMYVRLAFAVAAFLEPEVLIVDEVLAVGDAEFQKKCLGRMKDVSKNEGRTVMFVSHDLTAVENLCLRTVWMKNGSIFKSGATKAILGEYINNIHSRESKALPYEINNYLSINEFSFSPSNIDISEYVGFRINILAKEKMNIKNLTILFYSISESRIAVLDLREMINKAKIDDYNYAFEGSIKTVPFMEGTYRVGISLDINDFAEDILHLTEITVKRKVSKLGFLPYPAEVCGSVQLELI